MYNKYNCYFFTYSILNYLDLSAVCKTLANKNPRAVTAARLIPAFHQTGVPVANTPNSRKFLQI